MSRILGVKFGSDFFGGVGAETLEKQCRNTRRKTIGWKNSPRNSPANLQNFARQILKIRTKSTLQYLAIKLLLAQPLCRNVSGIFVVQFLEDFAGDFPGGFFWHFSHKNEEKNPATKSAKKSGGSKIKIREKSILPKIGPNYCIPS